MAVEATGAIYKSLYFDGEDSRDYGVYITGQAVYNAPEREVEMISIPGRNGQLALDGGRFENIEVTYPAGIFADTEADFAEAISNFRNLLCSRRGYVRLQDEYNPNEYRLAIYKSGLEVEPTMLRAGEFEIVFDCKPQRWLTDGETEIDVDSGDVISNPTLFESSPLLEVTGYGNITMNGYGISITNESYGDVIIKPSNSWKEVSGWTKSITFDAGMANTGDRINCSSFSVSFYLPSAVSSYTETVIGSGFNYGFITTLPEIGIMGMAFLAGTAEVNEYTVVATLADSTTFTATIGMQYDGNRTITMYFNPNPADIYGIMTAYFCDNNKIVLHSTADVIDPFVYLDCDLGEAYKIFNGEYASLNKYIDLGSDLPVLAPGANTISFDNTITDLKVVPRWWKI